jgi:comEA protein
MSANLSWQGLPRNNSGLPELKSFSLKTPRRFWIACLLILGSLIYCGILWIPPKKTQTPELKPIEINAKILPIAFVEEGPVNLNRATASDLEKLPGIGPTLAARIVAWRETHGPFKSLEDLLAIPGIGPKILEGLRDKVSVGPP